MFVFQKRSDFRQFAVNRPGFQWLRVFKLAGGFVTGLAVLAFHLVKHLGPVDGADENGAVGLGCLVEQFAHFFHAGFGKEHGQHRRRVQDCGFHSRSSFSRSARRSSRCSCTTDFSPGLSLKIPQKESMYSRVTGWKMMRSPSSTKLMRVPGLMP